MIRVKTLDELVEHAGQARALRLKGYPRPWPAAFVIGMPARTVHLLLERGVWLYEPRKRRAK